MDDSGGTEQEYKGRARQQAETPSRQAAGPPWTARALPRKGRPCRPTSLPAPACTSSCASGVSSTAASPPPPLSSPEDHRHEKYKGRPHNQPPHVRPCLSTTPTLRYCLRQGGRSRRINGFSPNRRAVAGGKRSGPGSLAAAGASKGGTAHAAAWALPSAAVTAAAEPADSAGAGAAAAAAAGTAAAGGAVPSAAGEPRRRRPATPSTTPSAPTIVLGATAAQQRRPRADASK